MKANVLIYVSRIPWWKQLSEIQESWGLEKQADSKEQIGQCGVKILEYEQRLIYRSNGQNYCSVSCSTINLEISFNLEIIIDREM